MNTSAPSQDDLIRADLQPPAPSTVAHAGSENCLPPGTRLGDFEITGIIGEGGFGIVYLAFDHSLRRTVAIKEYMPVALAGRGPDDSVAIRAPKHAQAFGSGLESYINEARLLAQFDHPSLVKVYRFWKQNQTAYMAMQYYEGHTLKYITEHHPELIDQAWLTDMLRSIIGALETLYSAQILHRDISPENIMVQRNGVPVLLDFGAARQVVIGGTPQDLTVILKPSFAPVEQYADDANLTQGPWTDIYALCAVGYSAILKKSPPSSIGRMIKDPMQRLQDLAPPGYSPDFLAALDQGLQVLPEFRPQSTAEFRALLGLEEAPIPTPLHVKIPPQFAARATPASPPPQKALAQDAATGAGEAPPADTGKKERSEIRAAAGMPRKPGGLRRREYALAAGVLLIAVAGIWFWGSDSKPVPIAADKAPPAASADSSPPLSPPVQASPASDAAPALAGNPAASQASTASQIAATLDKNETVLADDTHGASKAEPPPPAPMTLLTLNIKPWGTLYVNGVNKGVSPPLKRLQLPPGKYQVKIVNPNFPDFQTELQLANKKTFALMHDFAGKGSTP